MALTRRNLISATILGAAAAAAPMAQAKQKTPLKPMKVSPKRRVLIQSSSRYHNSGYLDFAGDQYEKLFGKEKYEILFIPYAKVAGTYDAYEKQVQDAFKPYGHKIVSIHRFKDPQKAVREAKAIAVGGGNTWYLPIIVAASLKRTKKHHTGSLLQDDKNDYYQSPQLRQISFWFRFDDERFRLHKRFCENRQNRHLLQRSC